MWRHRDQTPSFRTSEFPLSGSAVPFLLKSRYGYLNVGELYEYLADILMRSTGVRTDRVDFGLVNICSPITMFSHGFCCAPPSTVWPSGKSLLFTFAISQKQTYSSLDYVPETQAQHTSNQVTKWGVTAGKLDFITIGVGITQASDLGLRRLRSNELRYVYNFVGAMTRSLIRHQSLYIKAGQPYDEMHEAYDLVDLHNRIGHMSLKTLFTSVPYPLWVFSVDLWRTAPNLFSQRLITPSVALYYFMFLFDVVARYPRCNNDISMLRLGLGTVPTGINALFIDSVFAFVSSIRAPNDNNLGLTELIAPVVIHNFVENGTVQLDKYLTQNYRVELKRSAMRVVEHFRNSNTDVAALLMPPASTSLKLLFEDEDFASDLRTALISNKPRTLK